MSLEATNENQSPYVTMKMSRLVFTKKIFCIAFEAHLNFELKYFDYFTLRFQKGFLLLYLQQQLTLEKEMFVNLQLRIRHPIWE